MNTLVDLVIHRGEVQADCIAYTQLSADGEIAQQITYSQLDNAARHLASKMLNVVNPGERVLLAYPAGIDFIISFFACLYAGLVAVPVYPPFARNQWPRFAAIAKDSGASMICTVPGRRDAITKCCSQYAHMENLACIAYDTRHEPDSVTWKAPDIDGKSLAFLQYTSGTTGEPKGVMVSHGNILSNQAMITQVFDHSRDNIFVGWLPMYHDMGLIGNVLNPVYVGCHTVLMEPIAFLRQPLRWLKAISDFGATTSGAPNFAYEMCVRKISPEEKPQLDLSRWRNAFNGSEKVQSQTLHNFSEYFKECGFKKDAFLPCYGLAEATLFVSGKQSTTPFKTLVVDKLALAENRIETENISEKNKTALVSCGISVSSQVRIVNPETLNECAVNEIGEIWVSGEHVTRGYWNKDELSRKIFKASIEPRSSNAFLRTGDLGVIVDKELYITGRIKELIIVRGKNYYPQDIELTVQNSNPACRIGRGAAFGIDLKGEEQVVVVQEISKEHLRTFKAEDVECDIRIALRTQLNLEVAEIVLVKHASIPLTSSGKTRRQPVKQMYLQQSLPGIIRDTAAA